MTRKPALPTASRYVARAFVATLVALSATAIRADVWLSLDDAIEKARREDKLILADLRGCRFQSKTPDVVVDCPPADESLINAADQSPVVEHAYSSFVRARVDLDAETSPMVLRLRDQRPPTPVFAVVDTVGTIIVTWRMHGISSHLNNLNMVRSRMPAILRSAEQRASGRPAEADLTLGKVNLWLGHALNARRFFEQAASRFRTNGQQTRADFATLGIHEIDHLLGRRHKAIADLLKLAETASPEVAPDAWLTLGRMTAREGDAQRAVDYLRRASRAAKPDSPQQTAARAELRKLGHTAEARGDRTESTIQIVPPEQASLTDRAQFTAIAAPGVANVEWYLDERRISASSSAPFTLMLDLPPTPRPARLRALAYDEGGRPIARSTVVLNDRLDQPRVSIASPVATTLVGETMLDAEAYVPPGAAVQSVQFFYNEREVAKLTEPPYRVPFNVPSSFGFFRVLLTLDDGHTAEDTLMVNAGPGSRSEIHTIAFSATVTGKDGKHVRELTATDFAAFDEGAPVQLALDQTSNDPPTIGLLVDVSGSMTELLEPVVRVATALVDGLAGENALFLSTFDSHPRLAERPTREGSRLRRTLLDLHAEGQTAVIDGLVFALQQFTGVAGKKALILITDANEGSSAQTAEDCIAVARASGVPLYVIVPKGSVQLDSRFLRVLRTMSAVSGGLLFEAGPEDAGATTEKIREDVRAQYLLSFTAPQDVPPGTWRRVRLDVPRRAATVRTIGGYYTR